MNIGNFSNNTASFCGLIKVREKYINSDCIQHFQSYYTNNSSKNVRIITKNQGVVDLERVSAENFAKAFIRAQKEDFVNINDINKINGLDIGNSGNDSKTKSSFNKLDIDI